MKSSIQLSHIITGVAAFLLGAGVFWIYSPRSSPMENHDMHQHSDESSAVWTCSMHPQIRQSEPGSCPICGMDLIPLSENSSDNPLVLQMTPEAVKLAQIETTVIGQTGSAGKTRILSGKIQADERLSASQVAHIPGRIEKLFVSFEGESVSKGQKLAVIYSPELITAQQELIEAVKLQQVNPALLPAARKKLELWKISPAQIEAIEQEGKIQETFTLTADMSGIVTQRRIAVGDYVRQGQILFDLVSLGRVWVILDAYEEDLADIRLGDKVEFTSPAIPEKTFTTRVSFIDPVIDPVSRVAAIRGEISNSRGVLKPEMFIRGKIISGNDKSSSSQLMVPKSAVMWTGTRSVVYLKVPNQPVPSFEYREILLGERTGENYLISEGLLAGDEVVTYGNFVIDAAAQLNNQQSMMNKVVNAHEQVGAELPDFSASVPEEFHRQLGEILNLYLRLKDTLVQTHPEGSARMAKLLVGELQKTDMKNLEGEAHHFWMQQEKSLQAHAGQIASLEDIEEQRKQFSFLSEAMILTFKAYGNQGKPLYIQHCPMAFDFQGANWLSTEENILNPYFGDVMLTCGSVEGQIPKQKDTQSSSNHKH